MERRDRHEEHVRSLFVSNGGSGAFKTRVWEER